MKTEQRSLFDMFSFNIPLDRLPDVLSLLGHKKTIGNIVMPNTARKRMQKLFKVPSAIAANAKQVDEIAIANNTPIILSALEVSLIILLHLFHDMGKLNIAFSTRINIKLRSATNPSKTNLFCIWTPRPIRKNYPCQIK